jgi:hypothetical protein
MILPHPESDLSLNLMVIGTDIISFLKRTSHKNSFVLVENVMMDFLGKDEKRTPEMFIYSLTFLFAFGLIEKKEYKIKLNERTYFQPQLF